ncbi:MAG: MBL fold metallo-hydrolase, partial [Bacteroidota bacterium]
RSDPLWSGNASPGPLFGVKRFHEVPLALDDLPPLDAVLVTHDHYDHLDAETVVALSGRVPRWICPLGVGARLEGWGVPPEAVTELDWWESTPLTSPEASDVTVTATPARHFSGRSLRDRNTTLWCGYVLVEGGASGEWPVAEEDEASASPQPPVPRPSSVYVGGDGGYSALFREVGERLGPFDVALMEVGAYNDAWADIHMGPEQAVQAAIDAQAQVLLPVHWGTFNLALHGWTEPAERVLVAAQEAGLPLALPKPGESIDPGDPPEAVRWWPELPWQTAEEAPIVSSGVVPAGASTAFGTPASGARGPSVPRRAV